MEAPKKEKIIGIVGGMGPLATLHLFKKIIELTPAKKDQDHLRIIIDNNPKMPDRTQSILNRDKKIISHLIESAKNLEKGGAHCIVIACITSHCYLEEIQKNIRIPVLNMIRLTLDESINNDSRDIGLLATNGTLKNKLYQKYDEQQNINWITLEETEQKMLMNLIYKLKAGERYQNSRDTFRKLLSSLKKKGAESIILGCTELSLIKDMFDHRFKLIDPIETVALEAIKFAKSIS
jgi:aspartate racemase